MSIDIIGWISGWHIERFIASIFKSSKTMWEKISPEVQKAIIESSSVVAVINSMLTSTPQFILDKIIEKIPGMTEEKLHTLLTQVEKVLKISKEANSTDLVTTIGNIKDHIATLGDAWEGYSETLASFISFYNTPHETTFSVIASVMKFVYEHFVKGRV